MTTIYDGMIVFPEMEIGIHADDTIDILGFGPDPLDLLLLEPEEQREQLRTWSYQSGSC